MNSSKPAGYFTSDIIQIPYKNLGEIMAKANRSSTLGAEKLDRAGVKPSMTKAVTHGVWLRVSAISRCPVDTNFQAS